ncbi:hypothetical protein CCACVL1_05118 [Corchorus capsularis]|uniref:Uncharacterized protein n=1 Tax=Corchorus capsularis TaxID=210143 RepID=A0A1R3JMD4_COCAP|nr:hypothetical protein CCACVL1_24460 [Corchorus capsularis]OMO96022.1 hypothetical protein CCACVL1_05118 [Corchorus capsularis]
MNFPSSYGEEQLQEKESDIYLRQLTNKASSLHCSSE